MSDLRNDLLKAMEAKGYTFDRLRRESGIKCDGSSLNRKLRGDQALTAIEGRALAVALGVRVTSVSRLIQLANDLGIEAQWAKKAKVA